MRVGGPKIGYYTEGRGVDRHGGVWSKMAPLGFVWSRNLDHFFTVSPFADLICHRSGVGLCFKGA